MIVPIFLALVVFGTMGAGVSDAVTGSEYVKYIYTGDHPLGDGLRYLADVGQ